jgi:diguanylate cyclase (GGDEF)-like protein
MHTLIIHQNIETAKRISSYLYKERLVTSVATSINGAYKYLSSPTPPKLIVIDLDVNNDESLNYLKSLKQTKHTNWTPVLALLPDNEDTTIKAAVALGVDGFVIGNENELEIRCKASLLANLHKKINLLQNENIALHKQLKTDPLTQLANLETTFFYTEDMIRQSVLYNQNLSVLSVNIDNFEEYQNTFGYEAADFCVSIISAAIENSLDRPLDFVGKAGDKKFLAVLSDTNIEGANIVAEKMRRAVSALNILRKKGSTPKVMTISVGIASALGKEIDSVDQFIQQASAPVIRKKNQQIAGLSFEKSNTTTMGISIGDCLSSAVMEMQAC